MNIFIYGDESGVFDKQHQDFFVFGGLIFLSKEDREKSYRYFIHAENKIKSQYQYGSELKACVISNKHKAGLFRSTNNLIRYAFIIDEQMVSDGSFSHKKTKQRYLDYVYKVGLKRVLVTLMKQNKLQAKEVENIYIRFDEHTTATNGRYELCESIEAEFKRGVINNVYGTFHEPIFPSMKGTVEVSYRDSTADALIRASDIIANQSWHYARTGQTDKLKQKLEVITFP
ncbi:MULTISPECIES: DUF3800 domain-containing protein [Atopobium]|uniref:DUF3800 domain-containing protein n=1 Tax=Atopobium minutum 10063974 TaxID=997872 RepID=N2C0M0_9ACTN|nr:MULTISPECIES: DUF3800 domain-containing protein [Atopobium]EMZ42719.1 hypothetical protein HMPREF1091_00277 [Atopobium minutum 10063974]ERL15495.1 PF12686 family protein [Atopobium sp. BV3Ac4]